MASPAPTTFPKKDGATSPASNGADNKDTLTSKTASAPAPELQSINPYLHIYDPTTASTQAAPSSKTAHLPSLVPGVRAPAVVLIFGFMDGPLRIMTKYAAQYLARFPTSTLILHLSTGTGLLADQDERTARMRKLLPLLERAQERAESRRALRKRIRFIERNAAERSLDSTEQRRLRRLRKLQRKASVGTTASAAAASSGGEGTMGEDDFDDHDEDGDDEAAEDYLKPEERTPRGLLIHCFSDGGARNVWALLNELSSSTSPAQTLRLPPVRGHIFDCSPGYQTAGTSSLAFTMPLRKRYALWIVWLARASVWIYVRLALWWRTFVRRQPTDSERMRSALNSPQKWAWGWAPAAASLSDALDFTDVKEGAGGRHSWQLPPRLYLYSRADVLIPWEQVERHARDAARIQRTAAFSHEFIAQPELIVQEGPDGQAEGGKETKSALQAAANAGTVDPEMARWAELSAKFDSSFTRSRTPSSTTIPPTSDTTTPVEAGGVKKEVQPDSFNGVRLVRWEKAAHCDIGRHDLANYWANVDAWLAKV
ncbi:hypothetical protein V8E36_000144 [Tilletia maclaganii]